MAELMSVTALTAFLMAIFIYDIYAHYPCGITYLSVRSHACSVTCLAAFINIFWFKWSER